MDTTELKRIFKDHYNKIEGDNDSSPDFDSISVTLVSAVSTNSVTNLKLIDSEFP